MAKRVTSSDLVLAIALIALTSMAWANTNGHMGHLVIGGIGIVCVLIYYYFFRAKK